MSTRWCLSTGRSLRKLWSTLLNTPVTRSPHVWRCPVANSLRSVAASPFSRGFASGPRRRRKRKRRRKKHAAVPSSLVEIASESPEDAVFEVSAPQLSHGLASIGVSQPTCIQHAAMPVLRQGKDAVLASETGSGKTLAYLLPLMERLLHEKAQDPEGQAGPRAIICTFNRDLCAQVLDVVKSLVSKRKKKRRRKKKKQKETTSKSGDDEKKEGAEGVELVYYAAHGQAITLPPSLKQVDLVVTTADTLCNTLRQDAKVRSARRSAQPGREVSADDVELVAVDSDSSYPRVLVKDLRQFGSAGGGGGVLDHCHTLVFDEADVCLSGGKAGSELLRRVAAVKRDLLRDRKALSRYVQRLRQVDAGIDFQPEGRQLQCVFAGATLPHQQSHKAIGAMIHRYFPSARWLVSAGHHQFPPLRRHDWVQCPASSQEHEDIVGPDWVDEWRLERLLPLLGTADPPDHPNNTLVFCNSKARADSLHMELEPLAPPGSQLGLLSGEVPLQVRQAYVSRFIQGVEADPTAPQSHDTHDRQATDHAPWNVLVCTDMAGRGMDFGGVVDRVVEWDFAGNGIAQLHRVGRTSRMRAGASDRMGDLSSTADGDSSGSAVREGSVTTFYLPRDEYLVKRIQTEVESSFSRNRSLKRARRRAKYQQQREQGDAPSHTAGAVGVVGTDDAPPDQEWKHSSDHEWKQMVDEMGGVEGVEEDHVVGAEAWAQGDLMEKEFWELDSDDERAIDEFWTEQERKIQE